MTTLREMLQDYLATRRGLGFKLKCDGSGLATFVSFMEQRTAAHITTDLALSWAQQTRSATPTQRARRLGFVRNFARYCSAIDARNEVPPSGLIPSQRRRPPPYFFTDDDIQRLLQAASELPPRQAWSLRSATFHCLFGLLSVSGLRFCEARDLRPDDFDLAEGLLTIRSSKFGKSRLVPLHCSTVRVLTKYLARRNRILGRRPTDHLFVNHRGLPLTHDQALDTFRRLAKEIGLAPQAQRAKPGLHDLRHRFALNTVLQWYRGGDDVQRRLPVLSAYLGHSEVRNTYWYLSAHPELMGAALDRLEQFWEKTS